MTLSVTAMTLGERFAYSGRMLLIGMATVFSALAILWGALELFHLFLKLANARREKKETVEEPALPSVAEPVSDDGAVIAAITAAVAVVLAEENGGTAPAFRVVSYRRTRSSH